MLYLALYFLINGVGLIARQFLASTVVANKQDKTRINMKTQIVLIILFSIIINYCYSQNYTTIIPLNGGRVDWSDVNNRIAIDRKGVDDFYDIYIMNEDTSNIVCLTCDTIAPQNHSGNPSWHPSGKYILFQAEAEQTYLQVQHDIATPGRGRYNNVWVMDTSGTVFNNLTQIPYQISPHYGVLHPHFSHDGNMICWAEMISNNGTQGEWRVKIARFHENSGNPYIDSIQVYNPLGGIHFYETHGFSSNGNTLLFSATLNNQTFHSLEIYTFDTTTSALTNLSNLPDVWDEHAHYNKTGDKIIWMSSYGYSIDTTDFSSLKTEWWIMDSNGTNKQQISHFNNPFYPEYIPNNAAAGDIAFSPDGLRFFGYVITETIGGGSGINVICTLDTSANIITKNDLDDLCIYPNPVKSELKILLPMKDVQLKYKITDIQGQVIKTGCFLNNYNSINLDGLKSGCYVFTLMNNEELYRRKFIKY